MLADLPAGLFAEALDTSFAAYRVGRALRAARPNLALVEGDDTTFDLDGFAAAGHCTCAPFESPHLQLHTRWNAPFLVDPKFEDAWTAPYTARGATTRGDGSLVRSTSNGAYGVRWQGRDLVAVVATWSEGTCNHRHFWILAPERDTAEAFLVAVCRFGHAPRQEVLVINGERWKKDAELWAAIRASSLDDLVLPAPLRSEILDDFTTFSPRGRTTRGSGSRGSAACCCSAHPATARPTACAACSRRLELPTLYIHSSDRATTPTSATSRRVFDRARASPRAW